MSKAKIIVDRGGGYYSWNGKLYQSDIVRSAMRPKARAIGKAVAKHIRKSVEGTSVNPEPYLHFLLEEPNPYMTGQQLQEKLATQLELNNNAFAYINRDPNGLPMEIYIINELATDAVNKNGQFYLLLHMLTRYVDNFTYCSLLDF